MENILLKEDKDETLTIAASGRIDSGNAAECEKEIFSIMGAHPAEEMILDVENLEYISSAGLRVMLKIKKAQDHFKIVNASLEVYEIFDMTGFTDMIDVKKAFRKISVKDCEMIGKGGAGEVFRLDEETIIKVYTDGSTLEQIEREMNRAKHAFVSGVPTAIAYDVVDCDGKIGVVYEKVGETFSHYINSHPEEFDECAKRYAELLKTLHEAPVKEVDFGRFRDTYHERADKMIKYVSDDKVAKLHEFIDSIPYVDKLVHGDCHPNNVMLQNGELVLIDMATVACDHPIFEFGALYQDLVQITAQQCKAMVGLEKTQCEELWDKVIRYYLGTDDEGKLARFNQICKSVCALRFALLPAIGSDFIGKFADSILKKCEETFYPHIDEMIALVKSLEGGMI